MSIYPLGLRLEGKRVLVVGGGAVGTRRVKGLLQAGADVVVVSPVASAEIADLAIAGQLTWQHRGFQPGDTECAWLVHTATSDAVVDEAVTAECDAARIFCVNAAVAEDSSAWVPAATRHDGLTVASFGGGDPRRSMALRDAIAGLFESGELNAARSRDLGLETALETNSPLSQIGAAQVPGTVALVGGGPGHIGLISARGLALLKGADVVVADRLGPTDLLDDLAPNALIINVGKLPDHHPIPQDEINRILVQQAKAGHRVVRLKGGDPYVLGRGGEELDYCQDNSITVEVLPGITSAISVPAAAGIPLTHRGLATGFSVITGHTLDKQTGGLHAVAGGRDHTVVVLMGVTLLPEIAAALAAGERGPSCPVAIIEDGYGVNQRASFGTLETIAQIAADRGVRSPAVIVIGDVVLRSHLAPAGFAAEIELAN